MPLVSHKGSHTGGVTHHRPGAIVDVHAHQHVPREQFALHQFALTSADFHNLFNGHHNVVDGVLHLQGLGAHIQVSFHFIFVAGVALDDVPVAGEFFQLANVGTQAGFVFGQGRLFLGQLRVTQRCGSFLNDGGFFNNFRTGFFTHVFYSM